MKPKQTLIKQATANGSMDRMNQLLSAAHILHCEANNLVEEASDLMLSHGLMLGMLKKRHSDLTKSADVYFKEFASMVCTDKSKMDMFSDLDDFDQSFRKWAKVPADWEPKQLKGVEP